jgi:hypothetical protein
MEAGKSLAEARGAQVVEAQGVLTIRHGLSCVYRTQRACVRGADLKAWLNVAVQALNANAAAL